MKRINDIFPLLLFVVLLQIVIGIAGCKKDNLDNVNCSKINSKYSADIVPIINANCLSSGCHDAASAGRDYTTYNGLKAAVDNGSLESRVLDSKTMPPGRSLSMDDLKKIKCWINSGAPNN